MALQREVSPIPPGRYWILVEGGSAMRDFNSWLGDMHGAARVEATSLDQSTSPPSEFVIFNVPAGRMPFLNAAQFGFPSFAGPEIQSVQDVVQSERHMNPEDVAVEVIRKAGKAAENVADFGGLLVVALLFLMASGARH